MTNKLLIITAFLLIGLSNASALFAQDQCCGKCGCRENVQCVCRPIQTTKYIEITCWDSVCEDICLPPRSRCKEGCNNCIQSNNSQAGNNISIANSTQGVKIRSTNKLVRKTYLQPVPTVVWVVEYVCANCRSTNNVN
jgi:hypothetical protein